MHICDILFLFLQLQLCKNFNFTLKPVAKSVLQSSCSGLKSIETTSGPAGFGFGGIGKGLQLWLLLKRVSDVSHEIRSRISQGQETLHTTGKGR